jgi:hypothetical protein
MILEAIASHDLWIWHVYFGMPGSYNDINVLHRSPIFSSTLREENTPVTFTVNGHTYNTGYYLADDIYPNWAPFVKSVRNPIDEKTSYFSKMQESAQKDIEQTIGVLQARFAVVHGPAYGWDKTQVSNIMTTCIILHNMIVEDEGPMANNRNYERIGEEVDLRIGSQQTRQRFVQNLHRLCCHWTFPSTCCCFRRLSKGIRGVEVHRFVHWKYIITRHTRCLSWPNLHPFWMVFHNVTAMHEREAVTHCIGIKCSSL